LANFGGIDSFIPIGYALMDGSALLNACQRETWRKSLLVVNILRT